VSQLTWRQRREHIAQRGLSATARAFADQMPVAKRAMMTMVASCMDALQRRDQGLAGAATR
jgi:hypothetical protein